MTQKPLKHVVCAVRGGPESRSTVTRAIDLAFEAGARLTFLHIIDAEFLEYATIGPLSVVYKELVEMGEFAMLIICDRAERRGVAEVNYVLREGGIRKQLLQFAIETRADLIVIGHPTRSPGSNVFKTDELEEFIVTMRAEGQVEVFQVKAVDDATS